MDGPVSASQLRLLDHYFPVVRFEANSEFDRTRMPTTEDLRCHVVELGVQQNREQPERWLVTMGLQFTWPDVVSPPYSQAELAMIGVFSLPTDVEAGKRDQYLTISAPSMLYSAAREFVRIVTERAPAPAIRLPAVHFALCSLTPHEVADTKSEIAPEQR